MATVQRASERLQQEKRRHQHSVHQAAMAEEGASGAEAEGGAGAEEANGSGAAAQDGERLSIDQFDEEFVRLLRCGWAWVVIGWLVSRLALYHALRHWHQGHASGLPGDPTPCHTLVQPGRGQWNQALHHSPRAGAPRCGPHDCWGPDDAWRERCALTACPLALLNMHRRAVCQPYRPPRPGCHCRRPAQTSDNGGGACGTAECAPVRRDLHRSGRCTCRCCPHPTFDHSGPQA